MEIIPYKQVRSNLLSVMESVCEDHTPTIITRHNGRHVVILSLEDYSALIEPLLAKTLRTNKSLTKS